jgi:hypothetical protein
LSEAVETRWPVEIRFCVVASCELTFRSVCSAVIAEELVRRLEPILMSL